MKIIKMLVPVHSFLLDGRGARVQDSHPTPALCDGITAKSGEQAGDPGPVQFPTEDREQISRGGFYKKISIKIHLIHLIS